MLLTDEEFKARWTHIGKRGRKFIISYIENGLDAHRAAAEADFHGKYLKYPTSFPLRKYNDLINYLLKKNNIIDTLVKPEWVMVQFKKIYDETESEVTKVNILNQLSKILSMINTTPQINVENNMPSQPVIIKFNKDE